MAQTEDRVPADAPSSPGDGARPLPAKPPVIEVTPAEAPAAAPVRETPVDRIDSSLVGEGGLPPAAPRAEAAAEPAPGTPAEAARDMPGAQEAIVADAPDPGPVAGKEGPPPVLVSPPPPHPPAGRGGFWPLFLGGVAAAAIGSAATIWALPRLPENLRPLPDAPAAPIIDEAALRADVTAAAQAEVATRSDAILASAQEAAAEAARSAIAEAAAAAPGTEDSAADLEAAQQLQAGLDAIEDLSRRVEALEARPAMPETPADDGPAPAAAEEVAALRDELGRLAQRLDQLAAQPQADPAALAEVQALAAAAQDTQQQIEAAAAAVEQRLSDAESNAAAVEQQVADAARRTEALAALASLQSALQTGGDRTAAVQGLAAAGVEAPEALATPAPSIEALQQEFPDAARAGLRASLRDASAESPGGNVLTNFLRAQTGARSLEPRPGNDPDAVLSRAGDAVGRGDIPGAVSELQALPPEGREAMGDWLRGAEAWTAAAEAIGQIEGNLK